MCSGKVYWPGESYPLSDGYTVIMYALWAPLELKNLGNLNTTMQEFNCNEKLPNVHNYGTVTDSRDNNTYSVARLKDGRCWMTQNLRIINKTITQENSDTNKEFSIPASSPSGFSSTSGNTKYVIAAYYYDQGYGSFYTWFTATAGASVSDANDAGNALNSICPKSWRLFTKEEAQIFIDNYTFDTVQQTPINFVASGQMRQNGLDCSLKAPSPCNANGVLARWWSSTGANHCSNCSPYHIFFGSSTLSLGTGNYADTGYHVRCISR